VRPDLRTETPKDRLHVDRTPAVVKPEASAEPKPKPKRKRSRRSKVVHA
jgi:hypothetical protein